LVEPVLPCGGNKDGMVSVEHFRARIRYGFRNDSSLEYRAFADSRAFTSAKDYALVAIPSEVALADPALEASGSRSMRSLLRAVLEAFVEDTVASSTVSAGDSSFGGVGGGGGGGGACVVDLLPPMHME